MRGCKQCPAFGKCTVTYRGSACAALRSTYGEENDPEIITNADHIRSMTDEELAESITQLLYESLKASKCDCNLANDYKKQLLNWLQQQYKEDAE